MDEAWKILVLFKYTKTIPNVLAKITDFQVKLANAIFIASSHRMIIAQRINKHRRKNSRQQSKRYLETLENIKLACDVIVSMAKSYGDAFVFAILKNDMRRLQEGLEKQSSPVIPSLGTKGEVEAIKQIEAVGNCLPILNLTTNYLCEGDITFVDVEKMVIAGAAEVKSHPIEGELYSAQVAMILRDEPEKILLKKEAKSVKGKIRVIDEERFNRQIKKIKESFNKNQVIPDNINFTLSKSKGLIKFERFIQGLKKGKWEWCKLNKCVVAFAFHSRKKRLHALFNNDYSAEQISTIDIDEIVKVLFTGRSEGRGSCELHPFFWDEKGRAIKPMFGTKPLFWRNLSSKTLESIYSRKISIIMVYNPIPLYKAIEKEQIGNIRLTHGRKNLQITDKGMLIDNLNVFKRIMAQCLWGPTDIARIIKAFVCNLPQNAIGTYEMHGLEI